MLDRYEKMIHQGELPRLAIVPLPRILFHEEIEPARLRRVGARLEQDGVLRHPAIVARIPRSRRLLLVDGAHRVSALGELGLKHALVQIVGYEDRLTELKRWHHLLKLEDVERFLAQVGSIAGAQAAWRQGVAGSSPFYARRAQYAQVILADRNSLLLLPTDGCERHDPRWLNGATAALRTLCQLYKESGFLDRISYDEFDWLEANYAQYTALVVFPEFTKDEVVRVAKSPGKLPAGITRHLIPKRALRFDLPLWLLSRNLPLEELNRRLVEMILSRIQEGRIRFYTESTFSFDE